MGAQRAPELYLLTPLFCCAILDKVVLLLTTALGDVSMIP